MSIPSKVVGHFGILGGAFFIGMALLLIAGWNSGPGTDPMTFAGVVLFLYLAVTMLATGIRRAYP